MNCIQYWSEVNEGHAPNRDRLLPLNLMLELTSCLCCVVDLCSSCLGICTPPTMAAVGLVHNTGYGVAKPRIYDQTLNYVTELTTSFCRVKLLLDKAKCRDIFHLVVLLLLKMWLFMSRLGTVEPWPRQLILTPRQMSRSLERPWRELVSDSDSVVQKSSWASDMFDRVIKSRPPRKRKCN